MQLSHDRLLQEMFMYIWNKYPLTRYCYFHVTNELKPYPEESNKDYVIRLSKAKAIGVVSGVLDHILYWRGVLYAFDAKVGKDRLSSAQQQFISAVEKNGGKCFVIRNFDEFKIIIDKIMNDDRETQ